MQSTNSPASRSQPKASRTSAQKNQAILVGVVGFAPQARRLEHLLRNHHRMLGPRLLFLGRHPPLRARSHRAAWTSFPRIPDLGSSCSCSRASTNPAAAAPHFVCLMTGLARIVANCPPLASRGSAIVASRCTFTRATDPCLLARQVDKSCPPLFGSERRASVDASTQTFQFGLRLHFRLVAEVSPIQDFNRSGCLRSCESPGRQNRRPSAWR